MRYNRSAHIKLSWDIFQFQLNKRRSMFGGSAASWDIFQFQLNKRRSMFGGSAASWDIFQFQLNKRRSMFGGSAASWDIFQFRLQVRRFMPVASGDPIRVCGLRPPSSPSTANAIPLPPGGRRQPTKNIKFRQSIPSVDQIWRYKYEEKHQARCLRCRSRRGSRL